MQTTLHGVFNEEGTFQGLPPTIRRRLLRHALQGKATDAAAFEAWVEEAAPAATKLDRAKYLELERPSENVKPVTFASIDPQLFPRVVNMCVEEGKICMAEMMALDAQGGTGLAGTVNMSALIYDKHGAAARASRSSVGNPSRFWASARSRNWSRCWPQSPPPSTTSPSFRVP